MTAPFPAVALRDVIALTKPRLASMVLFTTAGGAWLAGASLTWPVTLWALLGTILAVLGAHSLNCYLERDTDALMHRTRNRPLPAGRIDPRLALALGVGLSAASLPVLALGTNPLTAALGLLALVSYVLVYTPMKTRSAWALGVGALPGALPPLMGWTAVTNRIQAPGLVLFAIMFLWQLPHFIAIALTLKTDYDRAGMKTLPQVMGDRHARAQAALYTLLLVPVTLLLVPLHVAGTVYAVVASVLGAAFLGWSLLGLQRDPGPRWARREFLLSLVYVTGLFGALSLRG
jgi:protoheme IX farnesyltransferase